MVSSNGSPQMGSLGEMPGLKNSLQNRLIHEGNAIWMRAKDGRFTKSFFYRKSSRIHGTRFRYASRGQTVPAWVPDDRLGDENGTRSGSVQPDKWVRTWAGG